MEESLRSNNALVSAQKTEIPINESLADKNKAEEVKIVYKDALNNTLVLAYSIGHFANDLVI